MGSLSREKTYRILLTALGLILLVGLLSPPVLSSDGINEQKLHQLEVLGLDVTDPTIQNVADGASTLNSVDVVPNGDNIDVIIQLSDLPSYKSSIYEDRRRMVVDLYNTINIAPSSEYALSDADPIRKVRNAQFEVTPSIISRVVLDLDDEVTPSITTEGTNLVISTPMSKEALSAELPIDTLQPAEAAAEETSVAAAPAPETDMPAETIAVPAVEVETETPEVEYTIARAVTGDEPTAETEEISSEGSATKEVTWTETPMIVDEPATTDEVVVEDLPEAEEAAEMPAGIAEPDEIEMAGNEPAESVEAVVAQVPEPDQAANVDDEMEDSSESEQGPVIMMDDEDMPAEDSDVTNDEAAKALNGMFAEMVDETPEESEPAEAPAKDMGQLFSEMFAEMAATMKADKAMQEAVASPPVQVSQATEPDKMLVSLNFRGADLGAVLDILARKGNLNIIAGKGVRGDVTVRLVDVPLDVALNAILNVNGYGYIKTDNIVRILPLSEIGDVVNMDTETYKLSYAKAEDAKKTLEPFLTKSGSIEVDKRTNMIVVTDVPGNKDRIETLITELDKRVQQVLIEVIVLDSVLSDDADLGVSWGLLNSDDHTPNSKEAVRLDEENPYPDQIGINLPTGANALNVIFGTMFDDIDLNIFIDAMVSDTDSRVLANPKILTLNNEMATIEIVQEFPYSDVTQTSSGGQLSNITFKEIGTKLEVKPQITHDDHVILWVAPEQNSIAGSTSTGVPIVDTRKAETTLILKNHQTIVMGGLRENRNVNTLSKVPFFGDLPGVKYAFRSVQSDKTDSELLVFLTVHIVESPQLLPEERIKAEELANLPRDPNSTIELIRP